MLPKPFQDTDYTITERLPGVGIEEAIERTCAALGGQGFGVLTEINIRATFKEKLGEEWPNYVILGACNPEIAHRALSGEAAVGVLLPCNVVVTEEDDGCVVSAIDPAAMFSVVKNEDVLPLAAWVKEKLTAALGSL